MPDESSDAERRWRRWWRRGLIVLGGTVALLLLACEVTLRIAYDRKFRLRSMPPVFAPSETTGYRYQPGARGLMCIPAFCREVSINEDGYPGPAFPLAKEKGRFRIGVVAHSQAVAFWNEDGENYISLMARDLAGRSRSIEVLNFSIDGARRGVENVELVRREVMRYAPDLVVLQTTVPLTTAGQSRTSYRGYVIQYPASSPEILERARTEIDGLERRYLFKALYYSSFLFRGFARGYYFRSDSQRAALIRAYIERRYVVGPDGRPVPYGTDNPTHVMSTPESLAVLKQLREVLESARTRLVLLLDAGAKAQQARAALEVEGFDVITMSLPSGKRYRMYDDGHLNRLGHEQVKEQLLPAILARLPVEAGGKL